MLKTPALGREVYGGDVTPAQPEGREPAARFRGSGVRIHFC